MVMSWIFTVLLLFSVTSAAILGKAIYSGQLNLAEVIRKFPQREG